MSWFQKISLRISPPTDQFNFRLCSDATIHTDLPTYISFDREHINISGPPDDPEPLIRLGIGRVNLDGDNDFIDLRLQVSQVFDVKESEDATGVVESSVAGLEPEIRGLVGKGGTGSGADGRGHYLFPIDILTS